MKKIIMKIDYLNKKNIFKITIFLSYLACWVSISTTFDDLIIYSQVQTFTIIDLINFFRHFGVYFFLFINFFLLIFNFKFLKFHSSKNLIYLFIFIYLLLQIPGLIQTENNIKNISFTISSFTVLFSIILIDNFFSQNEKKVLVYVILSFLSLVFFIKFIPDLINFLNAKYTLYGNFNTDSNLYLNKTEPRSSGLSRTMLVMIIFIEVMNWRKFLNRYLFESIKIFSILVILLYQSRLIIFLLILYLILSFIFNRRYNIKYFITEILKYIIIPIFLFLLLMNNFTIQKKNDYQNNLNYNLIENSKKSLRPFQSFSSGRFEDWKKILNNFDYKKSYGYGSMGDRYLINQSASNGAFYALTSSGIIGLISFLLFTLFALIISVKNILKGNYLQNNFIFYTNLIIIIILLRSLFESGYAVFGIDFIIFITCLSLINKKV